MLTHLSKFILFLTAECEIHVWHDVLLAAGRSRWKDHTRVEFTFTRGFGHVSEVAFGMCGNPPKDFSTHNSLQLTFILRGQHDL